MIPRTGICDYKDSPECLGCEFAAQKPESCSDQCEVCLLGPCPCRKMPERGGRSSYEVVHGPPRSAARPAKKKGDRVKIEKICESCEEPYMARRRDQKYCSECSGRSPARQAAAGERMKWEKTEALSPVRVLGIGAGLGVGSCLFLALVVYFLGAPIAAAFAVGLGTGVGSVKAVPYLVKLGQ